jgi:hypothetical protein
MSENKNIKLSSMSGLAPMVVEYCVDGKTHKSFIFYDFLNSKSYHLKGSVLFEEVSGDLSDALEKMIMQDQIPDAPQIPVDISSAMLQKGRAEMEGSTKGHVWEEMNKNKEESLDERIQHSDKHSDARQGE